MKKKIKLLTLCGTGGVTSAVVKVKARKILEEASSTPVSIEGVNVINGMAFLTGVGMDKLKEEILAEISKLG